MQCERGETEERRDRRGPESNRWAMELWVPTWALLKSGLGD